MELGGLFLRLCNQFMEKNSTSVSYEDGERIMSSLFYIMDQGGMNEGIMAGGESPEAIYQAGCRAIDEKILQARDLYRQIIRRFDAYGCILYEDTILRGIPEYFNRYDPCFGPMDTILTLDYPLLEDGINKESLAYSGITKIHYYLQRIYWEQELLEVFSREQIIWLLKTEFGSYEKNYYDNITYGVLWGLFKAAGNQTFPPSAHDFLENLLEKVKNQEAHPYILQVEKELQFKFEMYRGQ